MRVTRRVCMSVGAMFSVLAMIGSVLVAAPVSAQTPAPVPPPAPAVAPGMSPIPAAPAPKLPAGAPTSSPFPAPAGPVMPAPPRNVPLPASALPPHSTDPVAVALAQAKATGQRVEVVAKRSENDTTFANPDATLTTEISAGPVRVLQGGTFVPVDPTLVAAGGTVSPRAARGDIRFSAGSPADAEVAGITSAGTHVGFGWPAPLPAPTLSGATATYHDVVANGDLVVTATTTGFEVSLVLRKAPAGPVEVRLPVNVSGLAVAQSANGGLGLTGAAGATVASSPPPVMSSAARHARSGVATQSETVASTLESGPGGAVLVLRPDWAFLADPATEYPVTIDPAPALTSDLGTFVSAAFPATPNDTSTELRVGKYDTPATAVDRSFIRFNDSSIKGAQVTSAVLSLYEFWSWSCKDGTMWVDGAGALNPGATWNNQPSVDGRHWYTGSFHGGWTACPNSAGWQNLDITGLAQAWSSNGLSSPDALALLAQDEGDTNQWKRFNNINTTKPPQITVTYNAPTVPSAPRNVAAVAGNASVTVSWAEPAYVGQPPLSGYYIFNYRWDGQAWVDQTYKICGPGCTSTTFTGLANGSIYASNVAAANTVGLGGYGNAGYIPAGPPSAVQNLVAVSGNTTATIRWSPPAANEGVAEDFYLVVAYDTRDGSAAALAQVCGTCTSTYLTGLLNTHAYHVEVWGHNAPGTYGPGVTSNLISEAATDPMAGAGQRPDFTQQTFNLTDHLAASVNLGTGNLQLAATDLALPAVGGSVPLGRVYNSLSAAPGASDWFSTTFGYTWQFNQAPDVRLALNGDGSVTYDSPSGNAVTFTAAAGGAYTTPAGFDATMARNGDYTYTLTVHASAEVLRFATDGNLISGTDRNGNTLSYAYPDGRLVTTIAGTAGTAPANTATIVYGGPGGRVSTISQTADGTTRTVGYSYDPNGYSLLQVADADGLTTYRYDANVNISQIAGPGATTNFSYDANHRVTTVDRVIPGYPDSITNYDYTTPNHTKVTDPDGHPATDYTIDPTGRVTGVLDAKGQSTATAYTVDAKVHTFQNGSTGMTTNTYGANNGESLTLSRGPNGTLRAATYNNPAYPSLPDTGSDTMGNSGALNYIGPGNLSQITDALHNVTKYTYNTDGTVATSIDPANVANTNATVYGYNTVHQLTSVTPPTGNSLRPQGFGYDGFGRLQTATSGAGMTTTYSYDNLDRVRGESHSDSSPTLTYTYDANGNPHQRSVATATTTYTYDAANRLTAKAIPGGPTLTYSYDPAGNLTNTGGDGQPTATIYHYDNLNQVDQMTEPNGNIDIFAYNADHQRTDTWDNTGTPVAYDGTGNTIIAPTAFAAHIRATYDTANQLTEIKTTRASSNADANRVADLAYTYTVPNPTSCSAETPGLATSMRQTATDIVAGHTTTYCYDGLPPPKLALSSCGYWGVCVQ